MTIIMKQTTFTIIMAIAITMTQCKSPTTPVDTTTTQTDSTMKKIDTTAAVEEKTDTAKKATRAPLTLIINNLRSTTAGVVVGLYGTKNKFPDPKDQLKEYHFKPNGNTLTAHISDQNFGTYALAIYQDTKGAGKIAKNFIGIPTDPYAFSNNYRPKTKAPNFDDCKFSYDAKNNTITMNMIN